MASQPTVQTQRIVVRCRSCKNLVDEDSVFCEFCGANLIEDTPPVSHQPVQTPQPTVIPEPIPIAATERHAENESPIQADSHLSQTSVESAVDGVRAGPLGQPNEYEEALSSTPSISISDEQEESSHETPAASAPVAESYPSSEIFESIRRDESKSRWPVVIAVLFVLVVVGTALGLGGWFWSSRRAALARARQAQPIKPAPETPSAPEGMLYVKGGTFQMGRDDGDEYERPAHEVTVSSFFIDKYEITCEQYQKFVDATHHSTPPNWKEGRFPVGSEKLPVTGVTWDDANAYAEWAGKRLPTEEEWEFAARGNDGRRYTWGNDWRPNAANSSDTSANKLVDVGTFADGRSPSGAMDMIGNVWEWTASDLTAYPGGRLPSEPAKDSRVIRGGSWKEDKNQATTTYRGFLAARGAKDYSATGFRCVKGLGTGARVSEDSLNK
jgi:iron(II)-dependent oxidoreductase